MPYDKSKPPAKIAELPEHAQGVWIAAFNAALKQYDDEGKANATAWAAVERAGYKKDKDGKWSKVRESTVAESLVRLSVFGKDAKPEVRHVAADWAAVNNAGQFYRVPFTVVNDGHAFGQPVMMTVAEVDALPKPEPARAPAGGSEAPAEQFTAQESEQIALTVSEGVSIDGETFHAAPDKGEYPVFIVAEGINKGKKRQYSAKALDGVPSNFYAGCPMHLDHAGKEGEMPVRSVRDFCGKILKSGRAVVHEDVKKIPAVAKFVDGWTKEHMADPDWRSMIGLSHVADVAGYIGKVGGKPMKVIESIVKPYAVDVVSAAAFGGKVMESEAGSVDRRLEDMSMLESISIADLETHRPDLLKSIKESALVEFRAQESEDDAVKAEKARADKAEADLATARLDAHKLRVKEAVAAEVVKADHKIPEAARPLVINRVTTRLGGAEVSADKLSATVAAAVAEESKLGAAFMSKPAPRVPPNTAPADGDEKRAALQQRFDRMAGLPTKAAAQ